MDVKQIRELVIRELPVILQEDEEVQQLILRLAREHLADKIETGNRFDRLLDELRREREGQSKRWATQAKRWEEQDRRWTEQAKRWEENQKVINQMLQAIQALGRKHDSTIGALGARWGLHSEQSFRNALQGILEDSFGVQVLNVVEFDDEGEVFGHPDQVELDLIVKDGLLIICEIKSSMSRADMYAFGRKIEFYQKRHQRQVDRVLVISPMVDDPARRVAQKLGIQVYSYAEEVDPTQ
jgi:hypothetical protein